VRGTKTRATEEMANVFQKPDETNERLLNRTVSARSLRALDALNIFLADVRDGVGPYLAIYLLATHQWDPASIGIAMSAMGIATVIAQTPVGWLIDTLKQKRLLIVGAALLVGISCAAITAVPTAVHHRCPGAQRHRRGRVSACRRGHHPRPRRTPAIRSPHGS
jgi:Sugar phosphate permease